MEGWRQWNTKYLPNSYFFALCMSLAFMFFYCKYKSACYKADTTIQHWVLTTWSRRHVTNIASASWDFSYISWNLMVYFYVHKSMLLMLIFLCKNYPVDAMNLTCYINFNVVLPLQLTIPCFEFFHQIESPWFNHPSNIWWGVQVIKCLVLFYPVSFTSSPLTTRKRPQHSVFKHAWPVFFLY